MAITITAQDIKNNADIIKQFIRLNTTLTWTSLQRYQWNLTRNRLTSFSVITSSHEMTRICWMMSQDLNGWINLDKRLQCGSCMCYSTYLLRSETGGSHCDSMVLDKIIPEAEHRTNNWHWMMQKTPFSHWSEIVTACSLPEIRDGQNHAPEVGRGTGQ